MQNGVSVQNQKLNVKLDPDETALVFKSRLICVYTACTCIYFELPGWKGLGGREWGVSAGGGGGGDCIHLLNFSLFFSFYNR